MIAFIMDSENPSALKMTISFLQNLQADLKIIPMSHRDAHSFYETLSNYDEGFFLVFRAGDKIRAPQYERLLFHINQLSEKEVGIADEEEGREIIPVAWRTKAVCTIPRLVWENFPFKEYFFHHLYFSLGEQWTWHRERLSEYIVCQLHEPRWKKQGVAWELLFPILSARMLNADNTNPRVSIVICAYNDAHYLHCAIQSVFVQSNPNWELIIVNDGSTDNTREVISFFNEDSRIVVVENHENRGKAKCLNLALSISKGEWFLELDADDWLSQDCLHHMLTHNKDQEAILRYADYYEWIERKNQKIVFSQRRNSPMMLSKEMLLDNPLPIAPRMYNISFLKKMGGWCITDPYEGRLYEDLYLLSQCSSYPSLHIPFPLYHRRLRGNSISQREKGKFNHWKIWFTGM
jgi:hypothetical protein